jgi:ubiquinone/menaquinone biosynthesis C-methylase UbiE
VKQKDIFLRSEGDEWFHRNVDKLDKLTLPEDDSVLVDIIKSPIWDEDRLNVLEVGCGNGLRLKWLQENKNCTVYGIDPSGAAVNAAKQSGIKAEVGTADRLPFDDAFFDFIIFGFCLYLCDREDLFSIAREADRVLKKAGWIVIRDFYSTAETAVDYHHKKGVYSYKMDYSSMFTWNPAYTLFLQRIENHEKQNGVDNLQEWTASWIIRKNLR